MLRIQCILNEGLQALLHYWKREAADQEKFRLPTVQTHSSKRHPHSLLPPLVPSQ
jgi:hypothetical protein